MVTKKDKKDGIDLLNEEVSVAPEESVSMPSDEGEEEAGLEGQKESSEKSTSKPSTSKSQPQHDVAHEKQQNERLSTLEGEVEALEALDHALTKHYSELMERKADYQSGKAGFGTMGGLAGMAGGFMWNKSNRAAGYEARTKLINKTSKIINKTFGNGTLAKSDPAIGAIMERVLDLSHMRGGTHDAEIAERVAHQIQEIVRAVEGHFQEVLMPKLEKAGVPEASMAQAEKLFQARFRAHVRQVRGDGASFAFHKVLEHPSYQGILAKVGPEVQNFHSEIVSDEIADDMRALRTRLQGQGALKTENLQKAQEHLKQFHAEVEETLAKYPAKPYHEVVDGMIKGKSPDKVEAVAEAIKEVGDIFDRSKKGLFSSRPKAQRKAVAAASKNFFVRDVLGIQHSSNQNVADMFGAIMGKELYAEARRYGSDIHATLREGLSASVAKETYSGAGIPAAKVVLPTLLGVVVGGSLYHAMNKRKHEKIDSINQDIGRLNEQVREHGGTEMTEESAKKSQGFAERAQGERQAAEESVQRG